MKSFKEYLTESKKTYEFRVKIVGDLEGGVDSTMKTALEKFGVDSFAKAGKSVVQEHPLDFPQLKNEAVNLYDTTLNYPINAEGLRDYLCDYLDINHTHLKVRKPGEPTEEYQEPKQGEYETKLTDAEYKDAPKLKGEEHYGDKYNMSMLKALMDEDKGPKEDRQANPEGSTADDIKGIEPEAQGGPSPMGNKTSHTNAKNRGDTI
jgi:hypothetical protein